MAGPETGPTYSHQPTPRSQGGLALVLAFAFAALAFHLLVNAFGGYGIFRDEFYYIACSKRLAAGYVDQPPLAMFLMAAGRALFIGGGGEPSPASAVTPGLPLPRR